MNNEYVSAYVSASIHRLNSNGKNVTDNPSVSEKRKKWDTCCHFSNEFSSFSPGDWEVWLELFTRWSIADDQEISEWGYRAYVYSDIVVLNWEDYSQRSKTEIYMLP